MDEIFHESPAISFFERMAVMPELVWTEALFIYERPPYLNALDLRDPRDPDRWGNHDPVFDDLALIHGFTWLIDSFETNFVWRDFI